MRIFIWPAQDGGRVNWGKYPMDRLLFEHPLDELMRLSLRIECILKRFTDHIHRDCRISERICIASLVNLAHLLDRPDVKSKYAREFSAHMIQLEKIERTHDVDLLGLQETIAHLHDSLQFFSRPGKIGLNLRDNFFLNTIRQHVLSPGGEADFELPAYAFWLHTARSEKYRDLLQWYEEFLPVIQAITLLLKLTRAKTQKKQLTAFDGAYHEHLNGKHTAKLVQIYLDNQDAAYPVISAGKYRINIRFNEGKNLTAEEQAMRDINFELVLCF